MSSMHSDDTPINSSSSGKCTKNTTVFLLAGIVVVTLSVIVGLAVSRPLDSSSGTVYVNKATREGAAKILASANSAQNSGVCWNRIAELCDTFGPRFSGSQSLENAIDWITTKLQQDGIAVTTEAVNVTNWVRGKESLTMIQPRGRTLPVIGLGMSNATLNASGSFAPIRAEVLVVKSWDELEAQQARVPGKIVLFNVEFTTYSATVQYRANAAVRAQAFGAVAALIRSVAPYGLQTVHTGSSTTGLIPSAAITMEDAMQIQRFQDRGVVVELELYMEATFNPPAPSRNIVASITGKDKPNEFVVIGGHIDSWDNADGAMDDAGGAFVSWEALRLIKQQNLQPSRTIRVVFWTNEENGAAGGNAFAQRHIDELNQTSIAIESDTGAFQPYSLAFTGAAAAKAILLKMVPDLFPNGEPGGIVEDNGGGVDITPMCNLGVPCSSLEVLDHRASPGANNPCQGSALPATLDAASKVYGGYFWYHHTTADTPDKLDPVQLQNAAAAMAVWTLGIANLPDLLPRV